jgi:hypothetical protein
MTIFHTGLATAVRLFALIAGVWGLVAYLRKQGVSSNYWGILAVGELLFLAQGLVGLLLFVGGAQPGRTTMHILYGVVTVIGIPAYFAISKGKDDRQATLVYSLLCLALVGISFRSVATGY